MPEHLVLVDEPAHWKSGYPDYPVLGVRTYLTDPAWSDRRGLRVINLCRDTQYHSPGYYASLLAEARGHKVIPSVRTLQDLSRKALYGADLEDLHKRVEKVLGGHSGDIDTTRFEVTLFFGECSVGELRPLARSLFEAFRAPLLRVEFRRGRAGWHITALRAVGLRALQKHQEPAFFAAMENHLRRRWQRPRGRRAPRYDLAILHDPDEALAPSNRRALAAFLRAARKAGMEAELITRKDYARIAEYDALFIRETTNVNHHTYRFARKAAAEGLVVIDDPDSILRCTNKIYLAELLAREKIATPRSVIMGKDELDRAEEALGYPMVLKMPDGAFSTGVFKVKDRTELEDRARHMFKHSELLLAQAYTYTAFDWRVGVLAGEALYVCRYHMSRGHWQIIDHSAKGAAREGDADTLAVDAAPARVVQTALRAARRIGDGLYGVDLKETPDGVLVIEVNDNPSIDAGVEDKVLGEALYQRVMAEFGKRLEQRVSGRRPR
ncbi:MAG: RimK family protein [Gammaproteobacteria bacterium]